MGNSGDVKIYHPELSYTATAMGSQAIIKGDYFVEGVSAEDIVEDAVNRATDQLFGRWGNVGVITSVAITPVIVRDMTLILATVTGHPLTKADNDRVWKRVDAFRKSGIG